MHKYSSLFLFLFIPGLIIAQDRQRSSSQAVNKNGKDTIPQKTVIVTSAFTPSLKKSAKINFSAGAPIPDTDRPLLQYHVPAQNLFFTYESPSLRPLAASIDSIVHWENSNFVKVGYGNFTTPYLQAGISMGDGVHSMLNVFGKYTSSKGPLPFQQASKTGLNAIGIFNNEKNTQEWMGQLHYDGNTQYEYGFRPDTLTFTKDQLRQRFSSFGAKVGVRNKTINAANISYNPSLSLDLFSDNHHGAETNFIIQAPLSKSFGKIFSFDLGLTADITSFKGDTTTSNNNLYYLTPSLKFKTPNFILNAGLKPAWDNQVFSMLPDFSAEAKINDERFILLAGWIGYFNKTTYEYLAGLNPWIQQPTNLLNTRMSEQYAGFKGSAGSHFTYNAKVSFIKYNNQPLFLNDTMTGRSFQVINESTMKGIRLHGELGYTWQEKLSLLAAATFNQYSGLEINDKAWGLTPFQLTGTLRWQIFKDFLVKGDIFFQDGAPYLDAMKESRKLDPAIDLNAGVEFTILPKLNAWVQLNNLFNNKYQQWNQYPVLGFNVQAGVIYSFSQLGLTK
ncbi:MAG: hypothetical protein JSS67_01090 [Bacteroidetes bacterium]|nr:hypothetical protein [Bacteroidota bacterium]